LEALIAQGARDRSAVVRRVAAGGLIQHRSSVSNLDEVVQLLAGDKSASVRERAEFVLREQSSETAVNRV
jgi:HEAT repeat protein